LKTQWSLGQITPYIGSKAFDALKLWSVIKYFGRSGIEGLIDARLQLTKDFQDAITRHEDLILLNETDINSCMFIFMPRFCQGGRISAADLEKLNRCNEFIKTHINESGNVYVHGFNLKRCPNPLLPEDKVTYVLRTINGNPLTTIGHLKEILNTIVALGHRFFLEHQYYCVQNPSAFHETPVFGRLKQVVSSFMRQTEITEYAALIYGSSALPGNFIRSDVDLLVFATDQFRTTDNVRKLKDLILPIFIEENIPFDTGVPLERKLLIPISFAMASSDDVPFVSSPVEAVLTSEEYEASDEMLHRLIFNVLTTPSIHLCGSPDLVEAARYSCEQRLLDVISRESTANDEFTFAKNAIGKGDQQGIAYLGYKDRPEVHFHLQNIYARHNQTRPKGEAAASQNIATSSQYAAPQLYQEEGLSSKFTLPCVVLLNSFPGVGKFTIGKALQKALHPTASTRLIDNQLLIDRVEAIEPGPTKAHYGLLQDFRDLAFKRLREIEDKNLVIIMTVCLRNSLGDHKQVAEYQELARDRGVPLFTVNLECDTSMNEERLCNPERMAMGRTKLSDAGSLFRLYQNQALLDPSMVEASGYDLETYHLTLDTSSLSVEETVDAVMRFLSKSPEDEMLN
jgi:hypothetical protein